MLILQRLRVRNFVCFDDLVIEPSTDQERRLTVVRAENGSGKTTLLRAILWGLYGDEALPRQQGRPFRLHPVDWTPDSGPVETRVEVEFKTEISTGDRSKSSREIRGFLTRSAVTSAGRSQESDGADFRRLPSKLTLMRAHPITGAWGEWGGLPEQQVLENLLPFDLRSFFVVDAEEATDFVGGVEAKDLSRAQVVDKTTGAVQALLGLDAFRAAQTHLEKLEQTFRREASRACDSDELARRQAEVDQLEKEARAVSTTLTEAHATLDDLRSRRAQANAELRSLLTGSGDRDQLRRLKARLDQEYTESRRAWKNTLSSLSDVMASREILGALGAETLEQVFHLLRPLHDDGLIPMRHVPFVRRLLDERECVCGEPLDDGTPRRDVVLRIVEDSTASQRADHLGHVFDFSRTLAQSTVQRWEDTARDVVERKTDLEQRLEDIVGEQDELQRKLDRLDDERIDVCQNALRAINTQIGNTERSVGTMEGKKRNKEQRLHAMRKRLDADTRRSRGAREGRQCQELTATLRAILKGAYDRILREQVHELSSSMRTLFREMALNVRDDTARGADEGKARLAMIAEVGVRATRHRDQSFEIYATDARGHFMPPTEINGASRRVLALSFILAICEVSGVRSFFVADSLLNFMSGHVRTNALRATTQHCPQPILLLTPADLAAEHERRLVREYAGRCYTLTGQWQHGSERGDVVNLTDPRHISLLCRCGPESYCPTCERHA